MFLSLLATSPKGLMALPPVFVFAVPMVRIVIISGALVRLVFYSVLCVLGLPVIALLFRCGFFFRLAVSFASVIVSSLCVPPLAACFMILNFFGVMIQIFTSSFRRACRLDSSKFFVVSISRFPPKWFKGYCCFEFAPSAQLLNDYHKGLSDFNYSRSYRRQVLDRIDVHKVFEGLAVLADGRDIVLCCFEDAFQFCHRRLLARFVQERFDYFIQEYI